MNRRDFLRAALLGLAATPLILSDSQKNRKIETLWQINPYKCTQCGKCETACILPHSAVRCVHHYASCGYCLFCSGYYHDQRATFDTAGENLRCPTDAISRTYIEDPYFQYTVDEGKCIGCGKCVKGCAAFGNGSLYLQVKHDICVNCNECSIARVCPSGAFVRVSPDDPYFLLGESGGDK